MPVRESSSASSSTSDSDITKRRRQPSLTRVIAVDTSRAKSNADVVRHCIQQFGWKDYPEGRKDGRPCDIYWHNIVYSDIKDVVLSGSKVNKFPGMNELSRKISLTRALSSMQKLFPDQFDFCPKSWFIPAQLEEFYEDYYCMLEQRISQVPWFIVKPDEGAQGCGIYLIHSPEQLTNLDQPQLIQEYLDEPFLFQDKLKFDFRVYAVLKSLNPLNVFIAREGMARFCTQKYRAPSVSNSDQVFMHLTNYSLNKTNTEYVHSNNLDNQGSKRLLSTVFHQMDARGINTRKVWHNIKLIVVKTILAMVPELILHYENQFSSSANAALQGPSCFHILGFDVLLTKDLEPILLEINACPSLSLAHEDSENREPGQKVVSVVDEAIKIPLVRDTLLLVTDQLPSRKRTFDSAKSQRSQISVDDSEPPYHGKPSLREIFPARFGQNCGSLLVLDRAAYLFMQFVSIKRTLLITNTGFRIFIRKCNLAGVISMEDLDALFVKIQKGHGQTKQGNAGVSFHGFVELLIAVSTFKYPEAQNLKDAVECLLNFCQMQLRHSGVRSARLRAEHVDDEDEENLTQIYLLPNRMPIKKPAEPRKLVTERIGKLKMRQSRDNNPVSLPKIN